MMTIILLFSNLKPKKKERNIIIICVISSHMCPIYIETPNSNTSPNLREETKPSDNR